MAGRPDGGPRARSTLGRIAAGLVVLVSGVGVLLCLAGVAGVWVARGALHGATADGVARIDGALAVAEGRLRDIGGGAGPADAWQDAAIGRAIVARSDSLGTVNGAIVALDRLPGVEAHALDGNRLQAIAGQFSDLADAAREGAAGARATAAELEMQVQETRAQVAAFGSAAGRWIDRGAIAATVLLAWLALAQASLFRSARHYVKRAP